MHRDTVWPSFTSALFQSMSLGPQYEEQFQILLDIFMRTQIGIRLLQIHLEQHHSDLLLLIQTRSDHFIFVESIIIALEESTLFQLSG